MTIMTIEDKLKELIADHLGVDRDVVTEASTFESLGADSLDKIEIIMACEEALEIDIPDQDADKINTVGEAIAYVKARKDVQSADAPIDIARHLANGDSK